MCDFIYFVNLIRFLRIICKQFLNIINFEIIQIHSPIFADVYLDKIKDNKLLSR